MTNIDIMSQECLCGNADVQSADQATRIVGGKESIPDKHPWQAELYFDTLLIYQLCCSSCTGWFVKEAYQQNYENESVQRKAIMSLDCPSVTQPRVGQSVESALIALAAFFWLIAHILTIFDKNTVF